MKAGETGWAPLGLKDNTAVHAPAGGAVSAQRSILEHTAQQGRIRVSPNTNNLCSPRSEKAALTSWENVGEFSTDQASALFTILQNSRGQRLHFSVCAV